jgi:hypothetical protein
MNILEFLNREERVRYVAVQLVTELMKANYMTTDPLGLANDIYDFILSEEAEELTEEEDEEIPF